MTTSTGPAPQADPAPVPGSDPRLERWAWLSVATAVATIALKTVAWLVTGSVGLLSDAAESGVNLVAAVLALVALTVARRPADHNHDYGHGKAEYFSAGVEGLLIFGAAAFIVVTSVQRLLDPQPLESVGIGLAISVGASVLNGAVGLLLIRTGRTHRSVTLVADGKHLLTDVWTSAGVVVGVLLVALTGWERLDPIVAIAVAVNILVTGYRLVAQSVRSLLDATLPPEDVETVRRVLDGFASDDVAFADLRTRESGRQRFVSVTVRVPGDWTVVRGHDLVDRVEGEVCAALPGATVHTHLEPHPAPGPGPVAGRSAP